MLARQVPRVCLWTLKVNARHLNSRVPKFVVLLPNVMWETVVIMNMMSLASLAALNAARLDAQIVLLIHAATTIVLRIANWNATLIIVEDAIVSGTRASDLDMFSVPERVPSAPHEMAKHWPSLLKMAVLFRRVLVSQLTIKTLASAFRLSSWLS